VSTAFQTATFNATMTATPYTWSTQADGSVKWTAGTPVTGIPCRINAMSAREAMRLGREFGTTVFECFYPARLGNGTAVSLTLDSVVSSGGTTYRVVGPAVDQGGASLLNMAILEVDQ